MPAIFLGASPKRDRNIDDICRMIRNCARASIFREIRFTLIGVPRSGTAPGRGSSYSELVFANASGPAPIAAGDAGTYWERITYSSSASSRRPEYKVKMGCHQGSRCRGHWRGVDAVLCRPTASVRVDQ